MRKILSASVLAMTVALGAPALAQTNQNLPAGVATALQAAQSPADVAALVAANPELAATIMFIAANAGVASPSQVVEVLGPTLSPSDLIALVQDASEATPSQADSVAAAAFSATGPNAALSSSIGDAALNGVLAAGTLTPGEVANEEAEIAAALAELLPGDIQTADTDGGLETAAIDDGGGLGGLGVGDGTSEAQENPTPN